MRKVVGAALVLALTAPPPAWALRVAQPRDTRIAVGLEEALHPVSAPDSLMATLSQVHRRSLEAFEHEFVERSADLIIVSAGSRELAALYQDHYAMRKGVLCRDDVPVVCVADPEGKRVGNGGAVGHALLTVAKDRWGELQQEYPYLSGRSIHQLRIVIVQAGGFGTRYTAGTSDASKTRMPTGAVIPQRPNQAPVTNEQSLTMMDAALVGAYKFTQQLRAAGQGGLVILNGDALLVTEPHVMNGISIITNPESIDEAVEKLGVLVIDPTTRKIVAFEEKPSEERLAELKRLYPECRHLRLTDRAIRQLDTNTGSCVVTDSHPQNYQRFFDAVIVIAELMWRRIQEGKPVYEIDMSNDFFIPLTTGQTSYLNRRVFGKAGLSRALAREEISALMGGSDVAWGGGAVVSAVTWGDRLRFYDAVYQQVRQNFPGLYAPQQDPTRTAFLDAGDDRTWYRLMTGDHILSRVFGVRPRVNSVLMDDARVPGTAVLSNSVAGPSVVVGEKAVLHGTDLFQGSRVGAGSVVYNVCGPVVMGPDQFLVQTPVQGMGSAIIYKGRDESLTKTVAYTTLFGQPALQALEGWRTEGGQAVLDLLGIHERGEALGRRPMKELAIWPVTRGRQINMALVAWMATGGQAPASYVRAPKVSYEQITRQVDFDQLRINQVLGPERRFRRAIAAGQIPANPASTLEELYRADRALVMAQRQLGVDQVKRNAARFSRAEGALRTNPNGLMELRAAIPPTFSGSRRLGTLYRRLSDAVSDKVLRRESPAAYGVTIARLKRGASSVADRRLRQTVRAIEALAPHQAPFVLHLKGVSITFKGEVVIHGYVYAPTLYQMQRALVGRLPFALPIVADRQAGDRQSVFLNLKVAQMIRPPTPAEFQALERAIEPLVEEAFGHSVVDAVSLVADGSDGDHQLAPPFPLGASSHVGLEEARFMRARVVRPPWSRREFVAAALFGIPAGVTWWSARGSQVRSVVSPEAAPAASPPAPVAIKDAATILEHVGAIAQTAGPLSLDAVDRVMELLVPEEWAARPDQATWRELPAAAQERLARRLAERPITVEGLVRRIGEQLQAQGTLQSPKTVEGFVHDITEFFQQLNRRPYDGMYAGVYRRIAGRAPTIQVPWAVIVGQLLKETAHFNAGGHPDGLMQVDTEVLADPRFWALLARAPYQLVTGRPGDYSPEQLQALLADPIFNIKVGVLHFREGLVRAARRVPRPETQQAAALSIYNQGVTWMLGAETYSRGTAERSPRFLGLTGGAIAGAKSSGAAPSVITYDDLKAHLRDPIEFRDAEGTLRRVQMSQEAYEIGTNYVETVLATARLLEYVVTWPPGAGLEEAAARFRQAQEAFVRELGEPAVRAAPVTIAQIIDLRTMTPEQRGNIVRVLRYLHPALGAHILLLGTPEIGDAFRDGLQRLQSSHNIFFLVGPSVLGTRLRLLRAPRIVYYGTDERLPAQLQRAAGDSVRIEWATLDDLTIFFQRLLASVRGVPMEEFVAGEQERARQWGALAQNL